MNMVDKMLSELYEEFRAKENNGALANYIPELSKVNPRNFGIVLTTVDGYQYSYGDADIEFTIQSVSKPFIYGMAIQEYGVKKVLEKISVEPSGDAFNSISLYPESGRPFNPMINAGAITATDMIWQKYREETTDRILKTFSTYAGSPLEIDESIYTSESTTGHRNRAIAHLLRNFNILQTEVDAPLDVYFKQCSIKVNCRQLSTMGATLANNGINPVTGKKALKAKYIPNVLSVMASCGMYDYSGEWIYNVGLPAKSGVGGAVLAVLPGQLSISVYSPLLDKKGNSVMGVDFCKTIADRFSLHLYKTPRQIKHVLRRQLTMRTVRSKHKRDTIAENLFEQFGSSFHVMELQGDLCFATCESFMRRISSECQTLILNMHRCTTMDDGALSLLIRLNDEFQRNGKRLFVTDYSHLDLLWSYNERHPTFLIFKELDDALYYLENTILESNGYEPKQEPVQLKDQQLLRGLSTAEVNELQKHLLYKCYEEGDTIIRKGSVAEDIFFIESGRVVIQDTSDENREFTLAIINSGNSFGEMALLDKQNRSANVKAQTRVTCFVMLYEILDNVESLAGIKIKILTNLGASLSSRLRTANKEIASFT
ncbi:MAG TPA: glutaminase A [Chitinophagaceae bacterium]|nr:glutaminase A [Chitinophagaceae bacterium]